jgi:hypothetical protein
MHLRDAFASLGWLALAGAILAALGLGVVACVVLVSAPPAAATAQDALLTPVYACPRTPCANSREPEISDRGCAPVFPVGEYGGVGVYGDNFRIRAPDTRLLLSGTAAITLSRESPAEYDRQFTPPALWESPEAIWKCTSSHQWKVALRF